MLYREINTVCSQIHTKHTNTLCGQNVQFSDRLATQLGKRAISFIISVCKWFCMEQFSYRWTDFYEILYLNFYFILLSTLNV